MIKNKINKNKIKHQRKTKRVIKINLKKLNKPSKIKDRQLKRKKSNHRIKQINKRHKRNKKNKKLLKNPQSLAEALHNFLL